MTEKDIIKKGFNAGYKLAEHKPELAAKLEQGLTDKEHPYALGFSAGAKTYAQEVSPEQEKTNYMDRLQNQFRKELKDKTNEPDKSKSKGFGID